MSKLLDKEPIYRLKISEKEKYKDNCKWFKEYIDYLVPYDSSIVENYRKMKLSYDLVNNNLEGFKNELEAFCNPTGEESALPGNKPEEILPYNRIHNNLNVIAGELLKRNDNHKIVLLSNKEIKSKNEDYKNAIRRSIQEKAMLEVEKIRMQQQGVSEREIQEFLQEFRTQKEPEDLDIKSFNTDWEIFNNKALKYCYYTQDVKSKKQNTIRHAFTADGCFLYVGWEYGEPVIKDLNNLHCGYYKSPDVPRVEKGDYFWHKQAITVADAYNLYGEKLTTEELNRLSTYSVTSQHRVDRRHDVVGGSAEMVFRNDTFDMLTSSQDISDKTVGQAMGQGINRRYNNERLIWKTHIEFKAFREIIFLTYYDEYSEPITEVVDKDYAIPEFAEKVKFKNKFGIDSSKYVWTDESGTYYEAEKLWIPRRYEVTRLGQDIYVDCREVPNQPLDIENPFKNFELSYKGRIFSNLNSTSVSPVERATPPMFQYFFVKHIQNRELAKYQGYTLDIDIDQIPDWLEEDHEGQKIPGRDKMSIWRLYLKKLGYNIYSGSQSADGLPPSTRSPGSRSSITGTAVELINLAQLLEYIDREIGMAMGISPQRKSNFSQGTNVSDNKQAITQSHHITEPYFYMHSEVWKSALNEWLRLFRMWIRNSFEENPNKKVHFLEYVAPDGSKELLEITRDMLDHEDIGLYLSNSGEDQFYRDTMLQLTHAFAQNSGEGMETVSSMIKSIASGSSPEEIHKIIQLNSKKQQERIQRMEQMKAEMAEKEMQRQTEWREDEQAHKIAEIDRKGEWTLKGKAMDVYRNQDDLNKDQDGIPDPIEAAMAVHQMNKENRELSQKDRELDIKEKEVKSKSSD